MSSRFSKWFLRAVIASAALVTLVGSVAISASARRARPMRQNFVMNEYMTVNFVDPSPAPEALANAAAQTGRFSSYVRNLLSMVSSRPAGRSQRAVGVTFPNHVRLTSPVADGVGIIKSSAAKTVHADIGFEFAIEDEYGGYWDFTYVARIFDPNGNQVQYGQHSVYQKPGTGAGISVNLADPIEGTYTGIVTWYIGSYALPQRQATLTVTYLVPAGETNTVGSWNGPYLNFTATLTGGSFNGRQVAEFDGDGFAFDACYYIGSPYDPFIHVSSAGSWKAINNNSYNDTVGWSDFDIAHYRSATPGNIPCKTTVSQAMKVNRPGQSPSTFITNRIEMTIGASTLSTSRALASDYRVY